MTSTATSPSAGKPTGKSSGGGIVISRRGEGDRAALDQMYVDVFGKEAAEASEARWRWQYDRNPHCPPEGPEIWVAKEDGTVLGQYATMPIRLKVKDRLLRASWGMDVMVRPNLQRKGVGSRLFLYWDRQVEASLGLGLSLASYTLFQKLNWNDVGPVPCYSKILSPRALLARRLGPFLAALVAPFVDAALWLFFPARGGRPRDVEVRPLEGKFGEDYQKLWDAASPGYDFIAERRPAYLEWKFHEVPYVDYEVFEARRAGRLTGYLVLRATERNGVKLGLLVDWLAHPDDRDTFSALADRALAWARERGVARVQTFTFDERVAAALGRKGFMKIDSPMQFCLRIHSDRVDLEDTFYRDRSRWHVTFGDSDQDREV